MTLATWATLDIWYSHRIVSQGRYLVTHRRRAWNICYPERPGRILGDGGPGLKVCSIILILFPLDRGGYQSVVGWILLAVAV